MSSLDLKAGDKVYSSKLSNSPVTITKVLENNVYEYTLKTRCCGEDVTVTKERKGSTENAIPTRFSDLYEKLISSSLTLSVVS